MPGVVSELQTLSGKALLPGFADDDDQEEVIAATVQEVSSLFKECERRLKEMGRTKSEGSGDEVNARARAAQRRANGKRWKKLPRAWRKRTAAARQRDAPLLTVPEPLCVPLLTVPEPLCVPLLTVPEPLCVFCAAVSAQKH